MPDLVPVRRVQERDRYRITWLWEEPCQEPRREPPSFGAWRMRSSEGPQGVTFSVPRSRGGELLAFILGSVTHSGVYYFQASSG